MIEITEITDNLKEMLKQDGLNFSKPDLKICWEVFKKFNNINEVYSEDKLLFECGICNFECEELFYLEFAKIYKCSTNEKTTSKKISIRIYYAPKKELNCLQTKIYSDSFNCLNEFYENIQKTREFTVPLKFIPLSAQVLWDEL